MSETPNPVETVDSGLETGRTDAANNKRTGDQAFGSCDNLIAKVASRSVTPQPTVAIPQSGDGTDGLSDVCGILTLPDVEPCNDSENGSQTVEVAVFCEAVPTTEAVTVMVTETEAVTVKVTETETAVPLATEVSLGEVRSSTVSDNKSSGSMDSTLQIGESAVTTVTDDLDDGYRALADLIDTSSKKCSYKDGYVKRQLVYACRTCTLDVLEPAGFCMACAVHCHDEHDVVPMLTRRDFRCDCGNTKFGPRKCQLTSEKDAINSENVYNQNFHGKICTCRKSLEAPGGSTTEDEDIVQCRLCEEQFHASHLGVIEDDFGDDWDGELVCHNCLNKHPFLQLYQAECNSPETTQDMYNRKKLIFILDPKDTFVAYEQREASKDLENVQRASDMTPEEIFAQICDGFDTVTQVELAHWFNNLKEVFVAFLHARIQAGQTITDADIEEFFTTFNNPENDDHDGLDHDAL
ncbi:putative E3 ubiquitin-protein ligase UBR7 [Hypsibius exemplaris]|uniref:E3 ubiquitin-protein ligase UBR7 n=1 Tax=Hypsibius exemplaris TaxID=2072580 RepID=A0A1W0W901_HYPEX|nr:putative E3 ubiquitin-protein ligase UBR7 [Hypsibius exemplaris]